MTDTEDTRWYAVRNSVPRLISRKDFKMVPSDESSELRKENAELHEEIRLARMIIDDAGKLYVEQRDEIIALRAEIADLKERAVYDATYAKNLLDAMRIDRDHHRATVARLRGEASP